MLSGNVEPRLLLSALAISVAFAPTPVALVLAWRRRASRLAAATGLLYWGLVIVAMEHANWGITEFSGVDLRTHAGFHYQMLAVYGLAALVMAAVVVGPLLRRGRALGWWGLLVLFVVGVGAEVVTASITTPHGMPPRYWIVGFALWAYPTAWAAALALSFGPVFSAARRSTA